MLTYSSEVLELLREIANTNEATAGAESAGHAIQLHRVEVLWTCGGVNSEQRDEGGTIGMYGVEAEGEGFQHILQSARKLVSTSGLQTESAQCAVGFSTLFKKSTTLSPNLTGNGVRESFGRTTAGGAVKSPWCTKLIVAAAVSR